MRRSLVHVLVLLLAVTAGCSGLFDDAAGDATVTPVDVPEFEPPLAPGVPAATADADTRRLDTVRLRRADRRVRNTSSYRLQRTTVIEGADGQVRIERDRRNRPDGAAIEQFTASSTGLFSPGVVESEVWTDGSAFWTRTRFSDGSTVVSRRHPDPPSFHLLGTELPGRLLAAADYRVQRVTDDGVVLRSTTPVRLSGPVIPVSFADRRNETARVTVREDGLVVALVYRYEATAGPDPVLVTVRQRVSAVNETTVFQPAWVEANQSALRSEAGG
ncbi:hypothetical protein ACFQJ5_04895 [Halomicroarcula sp. GCM10025324]|uniref:hypothetical protein n=1 Tax=Haloarcula TaxID=2237 RepID=UPI0023E8F2D9|nr:hypothetical protein [Halomicroarcula sp. ZS-22-S1]